MFARNTDAFGHSVHSVKSYPTALEVWRTETLGFAHRRYAQKGSGVDAPLPSCDGRSALSGVSTADSGCSTRRG
ncbi:hypothetical protein SBV1_350003 [Verrucomicrobia bacterium]|nr:hypothetical protein SBV1_350003 [Verrucomicrobiota bacterium]